MTVSHFAPGCSIENQCTVSLRAAPPLGSYCGQPAVNREQHTEPRGGKKLGQTVHSYNWQLAWLPASHAPVSSPFTATLSGILKLIVKHTGFNIIPEICSPNKADDYLHFHPPPVKFLSPWLCSFISCLTYFIRFLLRLCLLSLGNIWLAGYKQQ